MSYQTARPMELSDKPEDWRALPYHVALVPVDAAEVNSMEVGADRKCAPFDYTFGGAHEAGGDLVTRTLRDVLAGDAFHRVTVLTPPTAAEYSQLEDGGLAAYWLAAAREVNADLLLDVDSFSYPVKPRSKGELLSYALFLAGPVELLFPDREYKFDEVDLAVTLYDVAGLRGVGVTSRDALMGLVEADASGEDEISEVDRDRLRAARAFELGAAGGVLRQFRVSPADLKFRFGDRLGAGPSSGSFWTSLIIPSALLQREAEDFSARLTNDATIALAQDLAREIIEGDFEYIVRPRAKQKGLLFDATSATLARSEEVEGFLELRAPVQLPTTRDLLEPNVRLGDRSWTIDLVRGEVADLATRARQAAQDGSALAIARPLGGTGVYDQELLVLVPAESNLMQASYGADLSPAAPLDTFQIELTEDLATGGDAKQSWTFDLERSLGKEATAALLESGSVTPEGSTINSTVGAE